MKGNLKRALLLMLTLLVLAGTLLVVGCSKEEGADTVTNLRYDGENLQWTRVRKADKYLLTIDGGTPIEVAQSDNLTIAHPYKTEANFTLTLEAVIKEGDEENPKITLSFVNIGTPASLRVEDGKLVWDALPNVDGYQVMINGQVLEAVIPTNEYALTEGAFQCRVRGVKVLADPEQQNHNNGNYSIWSESVSGTVLSAPTGLSYDSTEFTWQKVNGASGYVVKINDKEYPTTEAKLTYTTNEDFTVSVKAVGDSANRKYDSAYTVAEQYYYLDTVTTLTVVDGKLDWNDIENATGYKININGMLQDGTLTASEYTKINSGESYQIRILPVVDGGKFFSQWSSVQTVNILAQPAVTFTGGSVMWTQIYNADGYDIVIEKDGAVVHTNTVDKTTVVYNAFPFAEAGEYSVRVQANANAQLGHYESRFSSPYTVRRLEATSSVVVTNNVEAADQIGITFAAVPYAKSYTLKINDVAYTTTTETSFSVNIAAMTSNLDASTVNFSVVANGEVSAESALLEGAAKTHSVTKLAAPTNVSVSGGIISWDTVNGAQAYVVTIDGHRTKVTTTMYHPDWAVGLHKVTVQAAGDGGNTVSSSFTAEKSITKLAAPTELQIDAEGYLRWVNPNTSGVAQFTVKLGSGQEVSASTNAFELQSYVATLLPGAVTQLTVCAKGDGTTTIDSDFSETGGIYKFSAPTGLAIQGSQLVWDAPTYNGQIPAKYLVTVTPAGGTPEEYYVTGSSWSGAALDAGTYFFTVQAIGAKYATGGAVSTWDSAASMGKSFTKLATVNVSTSADRYTWGAIPGASAYEVYVGGELKTTTRDLYFVPGFTTAGQQNVKIVVKGDTANYMDSDALEMRQIISAATRPEITAVRSGNSVTVTVTNLTIGSNIRQFVVSIGGVEQAPIVSGTSGTYSVMGAVGTVTIRVKAISGGFGTDGVFYIDSEYSTAQNV